MIARLLICPSPETLASHIGSGNVNHPDTLYFKAGVKLGIKEAKIIKEHYFLKPFSAKGRTVIVEDAALMTIEAQNALLKTIEELPQEAVLILGSASEEYLLPTILSRCEVIKIQETRSKVQNNKEDIEKLLNNSLDERFEYVEKHKKREELLSALVSYFHQNILKFPDFTSKVLQAEQWHKQNVNIRAILEYLMLVMPVRK